VDDPVAHIQLVEGVLRVQQSQGEDLPNVDQKGKSVVPGCAEPIPLSVWVEMQSSAAKSVVWWISSFYISIALMGDWRV
jgi:hypothetical protein